MAYQYITSRNARNYTYGREGNSIKYIVLHHWGERGQTFDGILKWFCDTPDCSTSAHYVVEENKVACIVDLSNTAWHAGIWAYNLQSIGIECRPEATEGDYRTVAELVAKIWKAYGKLPIIRHRDVPNVYTSCPGIWNVQKLVNLAEEYYKDEKVTKVNKANVPIQTVSPWAKPSWQQAKAMGICDGTRPLDNITRQETVAIVMSAFNILKNSQDKKES